MQRLVAVWKRVEEVAIHPLLTRATLETLESLETRQTSMKMEQLEILKVNITSCVHMYLSHFCMYRDVLHVAIYPHTDNSLTYMHTHYFYTHCSDLSATTCTDHSPLSVEEEVRFIRRYEEGYDLYDEKYEAWLKHHHPEALQTYCKSGNPVAPLTSQHRSDTQISSPSTSSKSDMPTPITPAAKHQTSRSTTSNTSLATTPKMPKSTSTVTRSPLADLVNLPANDRGSKSVNTGHARV